jgi:hypothetical protein
LLASKAGLWFVAALGPPAFVAIALVIASLTLKSVGGFLVTFAFAIILVFLLVLAVAATVLLFLVALRWTRGLMIRRFGHWSFQDILFWSLFVIAIPAVFFAVGSALLIHAGHLGMKGVDKTDEYLPLRAFERYEWSLSDTIPLLRIPETLHWKPKLGFPTMAGGALVLAFKLLLVLPLAELIGTALSSAFGPAAVETDASVDRSARANEEE